MTQGNNCLLEGQTEDLTEEDSIEDRTEEGRTEEKEATEIVTETGIERGSGTGKETGKETGNVAVRMRAGARARKTSAERRKTDFRTVHAIENVMKIGHANGIETVTGAHPVGHYVRLRIVFWIITYLVCTDETCQSVDRFLFFDGG